MRCTWAVKKEHYIQKTHLTIKKTIKYSHDKALKDKKKNMVTELEQHFQLLNGDEASQGKADSLVLPLEPCSVAELYCYTSFSYVKEIIFCQLLPGMIQEPIRKIAEFPLCRCLHLRGKKQRWCSGPQREGWGGVLTLQVSWEWKQRGSECPRSKRSLGGLMWHEVAR